MKSHAVSPYEKHDVGGHESRAGQINNTSDLRRRHFRLSPFMAIGIAAAGLALAVGLETGRSGSRRGAERTLGPVEAADYALQFLMRVRVTQRLERQRRPNSPQATNQVAIDTELARVREHSLYVAIKEMMADHLRSEGYARIPLTETRYPNKPWYPNDPMLSLDAKASIQAFITSLRISFLATNENLVTFLKNEEEANGAWIVVHRGAGHYDAAFALLIQLLCELPDDLEPVASSVTFHPIPEEEIDRRLRGYAQGPR
jgi:hypothetical protein